MGKGSAVRPLVLIGMDEFENHWEQTFTKENAMKNLSETMPTIACRSCGEPIVWAVTENNKRIPLDTSAVRGGNVVLEANGALARVVKPNPAVMRYRSHFVSCPQASSWRKR